MEEDPSDVEWWEQLRGDVALLEEKLGLPKRFFFSILKDDDWSFIIKLHALIETTVTHVLQGRLPSEMHAFAATLNLSGGRHSKLNLMDVFYLNLELLDGLVKELSHIRNRLVHNISNVGFDLRKYFDELPKNDATTFANRICSLEGDKCAHVREDPKDNLWSSSLIVLATMWCMIECNRLDSETDILERKLLEEEAKRAQSLSTSLQQGVSGLSESPEYRRLFELFQSKQEEDQKQ